MHAASIWAWHVCATICVGVCVGSTCVLMTCSQIQINILQQSQRHRGCKTAAVSVAKNDAHTVRAKSV